MLAPFKHLGAFCVGLWLTGAYFCLLLLLILTFPVWMVYLGGCAATGVTPPRWFMQIFEGLFDD